MSWVDRISSGMTITTGDGKQYTPEWKNAQKSVEFNISEFNFDGVSGTLVDRKEPMGRRFPLEIYFQGENHLDISSDFELSANDKRAWVLSHPYYDDILVHPVSLNFDNTGHNLTKITGTLIETISEIYPKSTLDPQEQAQQNFEDANESVASDFGGNVSEPSTKDITNIQDSQLDTYNRVTKDITDTTALEEYRNLYITANTAILNATADPIQAMRTAQAVLSYPSQLQVSVQNRLDTLVSTFNGLRDKLVNIVRRNDKFIYEANQTTIVNAMALAVTTPIEGDYENRDMVLSVIETLSNTYDQTIQDLDSLQTDNGGSEDSYIPSHSGLFDLNVSVKYAIANLFSIVVDAKQERSIILTAKSDPILLTHRFYGLDEADENLTKFIDQNKIGINEMFELDEGRTVVYYV